MADRDPVADIKSRLSIEDVVSRYVPLKRAGRSLKGLCPFHSEKTPSFVVSPERQMAYCFGCHRGGDLFTFIQEVEGVDFKGALDVLADRAGIDLSQYKSAAPANRVSRDQKEHWYALNEEVKKFYSELLYSTKEGKQALQYLEGRGFDAKTIQEFEVGLSPDSFDATYGHLVQKNYSKKDLLEVGLLTTRDTESQHVYDRFRARLMFPIRDAQNHLVGFGGRALKPEDDPKYLNSPESVIYHKSDLLYGLPQAKVAIRKEDLAIVVEGYMDVMASHQVDVRNVVASSGTAFTPEQLKILQRLTSNIAFAFDTDRAGEEALRRAIELGQTLDLNMKVIRVPQGKDPDECIHANPAAWTEAIANAPYYLDYYLQQMGQRYDLVSIEGKREACAHFMPLLKKVSSLERDHFIKKLSFVLSTDPTSLYDEFRRLKEAPRERHSEASVSTPPQKPFDDISYFLGLLLRFSSYVDSSLLGLPDGLFDDDAKKVYKSILDHYNDAAFVDVVSLLESFEEEDRKRWEVLMLLAETKNADLSEEKIKEEIQKVASELLRAYKKRQAVSLMQEIRGAQQNNDIERERALFQQYSTLLES